MRPRRQQSSRPFHPGPLAGGCRRRHLSKPRGKTKGGREARVLDVALNHHLASWRATAAGTAEVWMLESGAPASAAAEYYPYSGCLGWEDETDGDDEEYGELATSEERVRYEEPARDSDFDMDLPEMRMWGVLGVGGGNSVDAKEWEQGKEEEEEDEEEEEEQQEAASIDYHFGKKIKWKERQQTRKEIKRTQRRRHKWKKDSFPASGYLRDKTEEEEMEQEKHPAISYRDVEKMKRKEQRPLDDDDDGDGRDQDEGGQTEPGEVEQEAAKGGERVTRVKEREELEGGEVEQEGPNDDDDFGFCKVGFAWDCVDEEDWCVVKELEILFVGCGHVETEKTLF